MSGFCLMIAQTREFPTISTIASMERTVVMATSVDWSMIEEYQCNFVTCTKPGQKCVKPFDIDNHS